MKIYSSVSSENFRISASIFRSLVHFEIVFVYSVGSEFNFIHCQVKIQLIKNHILKKLFFFTVWSWAPFENKMVLFIYIDRYIDIKFYFISLSSSLVQTIPSSPFSLPLFWYLCPPIHFYSFFQNCDFPLWLRSVFSYQLIVQVSEVTNWVSNNSVPY